MLAPSRKVKSDFFGDFWRLWYSENHILTPSSKEPAPLRKIPGATPEQNSKCCVDSEEVSTRAQVHKNYFYSVVILSLTILMHYILTREVCIGRK